MKTIRIFLTITTLLLVMSCGGKDQKKEKEQIIVRNREAYDNDNKKNDESEKTVDTKDLIDMDNKGVGPVKNVVLGKTIDQSMAKAGEDVFNNLCIACHRPTQRLVGPAPLGVLKRRSPEWVMNMIVNPSEMIQKDSIAKQLVVQYNGAIMVDMGVTKDEARELVEYFRTLKK